jgi:hypothetical protein
LNLFSSASNFSALMDAGRKEWKKRQKGKSESGSQNRGKEYLDSHSP